MNAKQTLLEKIKDGSFALLTADEIAAKLRLKGKAAAGLNDILFTLCREGELLRDLRGRLGTAEQFGAVRGTISGNERGFGFFVPDDPTAEDLFIPHRALRGAYHGDTVLAFRKGGRAGDEGEVLAVLKRGCDRLVGLFRRERSGGFVHPDEKKFCDDIFVPSDRCKGAASGTKVVVRIYNFEGKTPKGEIVEVLGEGGDFFVEELSLIRSHNLKEEFPAEVLEEAERQAQRDPLESIAGRIDLRDELIITVDGEDTRDIDDAISIRKENGKYYLGVHIADVTHYVRWKGVLDHEAFARGTSVYFPDRVIPMLPTALSNNICSLNEGVPGRVYSTLDNSNNYAEFLVLFTPLCAAWAINLKDVRARFVFSCALALPMLALVMTYSRSGWLSFMLAVLVFVYYTDKRLIPVGFVACLLLIPFLPDSIVTRFLTIFNSADSSASYRIIVWRGVLLMLCDYGLTGIGLGPYTFDNVYPAYAMTEKAALVAHSQMLYLELFLEWGALGFIGFMWLMLRHVKDSCFAIVRSRRRELRWALMGTASAFFGIAVLSIFEYIWFYPRVLFAFAIVLGLGMACLRMDKKA